MLKLLRRTFAALPDTVTASVFLTLWIRPLAFGVHGVRNGMLVMIVEFVLIHATIFLPIALAVLVSGFKSRARGVAAVAVLVAIYLFFIVALSAAFQSWWPFIAFTWLLLGKAGLPIVEATGADDGGHEVAVWLVSVLTYIIGGLLITVLPLPQFGFADIEHGVLGLPSGASGIWIDEPYRVMAFGALYFYLLAWTKWSLAAPAGNALAERRMRLLARARAGRRRPPVERREAD